MWDYEDSSSLLSPTHTLVPYPCLPPCPTHDNTKEQHPYVHAHQLHTHSHNMYMSKYTHYAPACIPSTKRWTLETSRQQLKTAQLVLWACIWTPPPTHTHTHCHHTRPLGLSHYFVCHSTACEPFASTRTFNTMGLQEVSADSLPATTQLLCPQSQSDACSLRDSVRALYARRLLKVILPDPSQFCFAGL